MSNNKINKSDLLARISCARKDKNYEEEIELRTSYLKSDYEVDECFIIESIECLTKLGRFQEAERCIDLLSEIENRDINYQASLYSLAEMYARCNRPTKVKKIIESLEKNEQNQEYQLRASDYYYLGLICQNNGQLELAKEFFQTCLSLEDDKPEKDQHKKAKCHLKSIQVYNNNPSAFVEQSYSYFLSEGNHLEPGHIVMLSPNSIKTKYNPGIIKDGYDKTKKPFMIWKIEKVKDQQDGQMVEKTFIWAFPISVNLDDKYQYVFHQKDYPYRTQSRTLKPELYCIELNPCCNIYSVCDKIKPEHAFSALEAMYIRICRIEKGIWSENHKPFMQDWLKGKTPSIGDVIIVNNPSTNIPEHHFIYDIDLEHKRYKTIKTDKSLSPLPGTNTTCEANADIIAIFQVRYYDRQKELFRCAIGDDKEIPNISYTINAGKIIDFNGKKLEIMGETESHYKCMDISEGHNPTVINLIFVPKKDVIVFSAPFVPYIEYATQKQRYDNLPKTMAFPNQKKRIRTNLIPNKARIATLIKRDKLS